MKTLGKALMILLLLMVGLPPLRALAQSTRPKPTSQATRPATSSVKSEPTSPSVDETLASIAAILASNPTDSHKACMEQGHGVPYKLWVDDQHSVLYVNHYDINCKAPVEPMRYLVANLDTDVPIEGERTWDSDSYIKNPVISHDGDESDVSLSCRRQRPCERSPGDQKYVGGGNIDQWQGGFALFVKADIQTQEKLGRSLLHLVRLMTQESAHATVEQR